MIDEEPIDWNPDPKPPPSYAPVYAAALYPDLAAIARRHGYALCVHGSLQRDFDLVAVPWAETVSEPVAVVAEMLATFAIRQIGGAGVKNHGRIAFTLSIGHGHCAIDLSFMPKAAPPFVTGMTLVNPSHLAEYEREMREAVEQLVREKTRKWWHPLHGTG